MNEPIREVILGRNSKVWIGASSNVAIAERFRIGVGHAELDAFTFTARDRVWVFSYSREPEENSALLTRLEVAGVHEVVYVSSASTIVTRLTQCYEYPSVKFRAEQEARERLDARVLTLGLVYRSAGELPAGSNAATSERHLEEFLLSPSWPLDGGTRMNLFEIVEREFSGGLESLLYRLYGFFQWRIRRWPCILRPLDLVLRALGFRWYGYIHLSNRLWTTTRS